VDLLPAIDLRGGHCVRLLEGDFSAETVYGDDPVGVALGFAAAGARWVHVVDLDAARTGEASNRAVIAAIAEALRPAGASVQAGGGVRSVEDAGELLDAGVSRVVVGTAGVERPSLIADIDRRWPGRVALGLDHRSGEVRLRGWTQSAGVSVEDLVPSALDAGASALIVTDISRDGTMVGPDLEGLSSVVDLVALHRSRAAVATRPVSVIASGGVGSIADVAALAAIAGLGGIIAGRALYEKRLDLAEALAVVAEVTR